MDLTIYDFIGMFVEPCTQIVEVYNMSTEEYEFKGEASEVPDGLLGRTVCSLDSCRDNIICINISDEEL